MHRLSTIAAITFPTRLIVFVAAFVTALAHAATAPNSESLLREGDAVFRDFVFTSGEKLPELRIHYRTLGNPTRDAKGHVNNAVLIMHGTTGTGTQFLQQGFASELYLPGQPLDIRSHFIVLIDCIGHGDSSKPSDGLRAKFPRYGYRDVVTSQYRVLKEKLDVDHLLLVMGTSSGGMQTWLWGEMYPDFMDGLVPLGCLPIQVSGRNRVWRRMIIDAIRGDPAWQDGNYTVQPPSLRLAGQVAFFMSSNPVLRQKAMPTLQKSDEVLDAFIAGFLEHSDANDVLYAIESSYDYDPAPKLGEIKAQVLAINSFDDLIDPPELGVLEREIKRVPNGRIYMIPYDGNSRGHGSHTYPKLWKAELLDLLDDIAAAKKAAKP